METKMKDISIANDIVPVGQFKSGLAKYLNEVQSKRNSLIITQNGKPAGVLISPEEFDDLRQTKLFIDSISRGLSDSDKGAVLTTAQIKRELIKSASRIK
jgi:prevent-host-death family protein